jgi:RNA polymerase sigma-70 factor (ECF subfamily)
MNSNLDGVSRKKVWAACYRVTGSAADADEIVQEALARAIETKPVVSEEQPLEPWVMRVAVRLSVDRLRRRRETPYDGPWLPSPVEVDEELMTPAARYEIVESATFAFLLALEALTPAQRAVVVLRDVLDMSALEAARTLDESEANVRALHHRARTKLAGYDASRVRPDAAAQKRARDVLEALFGYLATGDTKNALGLLAESARLVNDAGGVYHAARKVVVGPDRIVRFYSGLLRKLGMPSDFRIRVLNGMPAAEMFYPAKRRYAPHLVTGILLDGSGRVETIYSVLAPTKLNALKQ